MHDSSAAQRETATEVREGVIRLSRRLRAERSPRSLSTGKLGVLGRLRRHGAATAGELAAAEHQLPQSLTRVFAELEHDGLIRRARDPWDGRRFVLDITEAGRRALGREVAEWDAWLASALTELTDIEQQILRLGARLLGRLADIEPTDATAYPSDL